MKSHPMKATLETAASHPGVAPETGWHGMDVRWLVTRGTVGASDVVFGVTFFPPGSKHDIHRHPNAEEVEYLIGGKGIARVGEDDVELAPGEAVYVPRNEYHGFANTSDETAVMAWCYAGAGSLEEAGYVTLANDERASDPAD